MNSKTLTQYNGNDWVEGFSSLSAQDRLDGFNDFASLTYLKQGEMLEIMFQKKDYQDMGYNNFNDYVNAELPFSDRTAKR